MNASSSALLGVLAALLTILACSLRGRRYPGQHWISDNGRNPTYWTFALGLTLSAILCAPLLVGIASENGSVGSRTTIAYVAVAGLTLLAWFDMKRWPAVHVVTAQLFFVGLLLFIFPESLSSAQTASTDLTRAVLVPYLMFVVATQAGLFLEYGFPKMYGFQNTVQYLTSDQQTPALRTIRWLEWVTVAAILVWIAGKALASS